MTDDLFINFVLDQSGSMGSLVDTTIVGFNAFVEEQASMAGDNYLSLTLFDTTVDCRFDAVELALVPPMARRGVNSYSPQGGTALYDAVGMSIEAVEAWVVKHPTFDGRIITAIQTDGMENSSRTWTLDNLNQLIRAKTEEGWEFAFLGAGEAAWTEGDKLAVPKAANMSYDATIGGQSMAYATFTNSVTNSRTTNTPLADNMTPKQAS